MTNRKKLPDNWWDLGINPIVGYKIPKAKNPSKKRRNKFEYPPEGDIKL
tara:strand:+ start:2767 stop:2913 length:147 start_codon:yes stop_codon:yes gene_type:complete